MAPVAMTEAEYHDEHGVLKEINCATGRCTNSLEKQYSPPGQGR